MSALVAAQVLVSLTFLVSGLAKLRDPRATEDAMRSLRLPVRPLHRMGSVLLAPGELVLALAAWIPVTEVQVAVGALSLCLALAYLVIIARALRFPDPVHCSCFGTLGSPTVSRMTLGRNIVLVLLAVVALVSAAAGATAHAEKTSPGGVLAWSAALAVAVVLTWLTLGGTSASGSRDDVQAADPDLRPAGSVALGEEPDEEGLLDYVRAPIPHTVVRRPDAELVPLRQLGRGRAVLLVWINPGCGPCERVTDRLPEWREQLGPAVAIHPIVPRPFDTIDPRELDRLGPEPVEDIAFTVAQSVGAVGTPSAVLLGADGLLAGGPVSGADQVQEFVEEIREQLADAPRRSDIS